MGGVVGGIRDQQGGRPMDACGQLVVFGMCRIGRKHTTLIEREMEF